MDFHPTLENNRALLRPLQQEDVALLKPIAMAQPELYRYMSAFIYTEEDLARFVAQAIADRDAQRSIPFLVIDKANNAVAGSTRLGNIDEKNKRAEIGWTWVDERFHRTGLNRAMKYLMLEYAFTTLDVNRVEIKTNELNTRSRRAIEAIGGQYEGLARHHMVNDDGTLRNTVYYSILIEEWPGIKDRVFAKYFTDWY
ncbi:GNAT family N-acetyltransferase [Taibaiella koreensis]|uniref:GNAT family N-acetyltransferase n=1 Tax=Taibaiella koreensis TaxID=1268548 RepID=UPI000E59A343|nr:GNAT family N-acetyltransferase [Taibaiella koreensis]